MSRAALESIASHSGAELDAAATAGGSIWLSSRAGGQAASYRVEVPAGLHLAFGIATMRTRGRAIGGFQSRGPVLTAMLPGDEPVEFATCMGREPARTLGFHVAAPVDGDAEWLEVIARRLATQRLRAATSGAALHRCLRLLDPIDPWFQGSTRELVLQARALELVAIVERWLGDSGQQSVDPRTARRADAAREFIDSRLAEPLTLELIARQVATNVRTLSAAFRVRFGISIAGYITAQRMTRGRQYLAEGASVAEAAYATGYRPSAFSVAFRRHFGVAPSSWRQRVVR